MATDSVAAESAVRDSSARTMLAQRLTAVAAELLPEPVPSPRDTAECYELLDRLLAVAHESASELWLLYIALTGVFPTTDALLELKRRLLVAEPIDRVPVALGETRSVAAELGDWDSPLRVVDAGALIDVNFCARHHHNTGIQRVVRKMLPHMMLHGSGPAPELIAWNPKSSAMCTLSPGERARVLEWNGGAGLGPAPLGRIARQQRELIVPWRSRLLLPEVAEPQLLDRLACLAEHSGNAVSMIGYDMIPIGSADLVSQNESERFARYLSVVKHADRVIAISSAVAEEFGGFVDSLRAQGIGGPVVDHVSLAEELGGESGPADAADATEYPLILCVGSHEPRKNQDAVLFALRQLHREGQLFRAVFLGGGNREHTHPFDRRVSSLRRSEGMRLRTLRGVGDDELVALYRDARFTVFVSRQEGFGLPIVESLSFGTPVLTSDYGSQAEIAAAGGAVTVDPRDDEAILVAMRELLADDGVLGRLHAEIAVRPGRSWADYAAELWESAGMEVMP